MSTSYPSGIDAFTRPQATDTQDNPSHSDLHDDTFDAIEAIETELGTSPSGASATVAARLDAVDTTLGTKADLVAGTVPTNQLPTLVTSVNGDTGTVVLTAADVGADATGTAAALVDDLSGVSNPSTARTNLGLGGAATLAVGTTTGTVAAGDDSRFTQQARSGLIPLILPPTTTNGTWVLVQNSTAFGAAWTTNTSQSNGDYAEWPDADLYLPAGTYSFWLYASALSNAPIIDVAIGGVNVATSVDLYSAGTAQTRFELATGVAITAGYKTLRFTANGKNASSSSYLMRLHGFGFRRTGA